VVRTDFNDRLPTYEIPRFF